MPKFRVRIKLNIVFSFILLALVAGAGIFIWAQQNTGGIPPTSEYAPNFWFDKDEKYFPTDPLKFYYDENLNELPGSKAVENYNKLSLEEKLNNFTVFYKIDDMGTEIVYEYWLFYVFNKGDWNDHYGDWESIFVFVDKDTKNIIRALGSFHQGGAINNELLGFQLRDTQHIWDYVANGSHSNCLDYIDDGRCNSLKTRVVEGDMFSTYSSSDPKILNDAPYYHLHSLKSLLETYTSKYPADRPMISESPNLGFGHYDFEVSIPFAGKQNIEGYLTGAGGEAPNNPWAKKEYKNPYAARPFTTERVTAWLRNTANQVGSALADITSRLTAAVQKGASFLADSFFDVFFELSPAGIGPAIQVSNIAGGIFINQPQTEYGDQGPVSETSPVEGAEVNRAPTSVDLDQIADQLDDISERTEILQMQLASLSRPALSGTGQGWLTQIQPENQSDKPDVTQKITKENQEEESAMSRSTTSSGIPSSPPSTPKTYPKILISELKSEGATVKDEYIELYNPNDSVVDLTGWMLRKKTSGGNESNLVSSSALSGPIPAKGYFLIVPQPNDDGTSNYTGSTQPDLFYSGKTYSFARDNTILLYDPNEELKDKVGFGSALDYETSPAQNPTVENSIGRKWNEVTMTYEDTDNNAIDFELQEPSPKAKNVTPTEPEQESAPAENTADLCSNEIDDDNDTLIDLNDPDCVEFVPEPEPEPEHELLPQTIVINEIAWMGTKPNPSGGFTPQAAAADEWIELFNNTDQPIDIAGWRLVSSDVFPDCGRACGPNIIFATSSTTLIPAGGYYLLERTDDTTTSERADWAGSFGNGLDNDTCEILYLYDAAGTLIDQTACNEDESWPAGNNETKQTMERIGASAPGSDPANWANNNLLTRNGRNSGGSTINGTPRKQNSVSVPQTVLNNSKLAELFNEFEELTLTFYGSLYMAQDKVVIPEGKILQIEPGVVAKFNSRIMPVGAFEVKGTLKAVGTEDNKITFTNDGDCFWGGIGFTSTSIDSELQYIILEISSTSGCGINSNAISITEAAVRVENSNISVTGAKNGQVGIYLRNTPPETILENITVTGFYLSDITPPSAVYIDGGSPTIRNSSFNSNSYAIAISNASPTIEGNVFENNNVPIRVTGVSYPIFGENTAINNQVVDGIIFSGASIDQDHLWSSNLPFVVEGQFTVGPDAVLTIAPGIVVKFKHPGSSSNIGFVVEGSLMAVGTLEAPIEFTAFESSPSPQGGYFVISLQGSGSSILDNVVVRYGGMRHTSNVWEGYRPPKGAIMVEDVAELSLVNSVIEYSAHAGVKILSSGLVVVDNTIIRNHLGYYCNDTSCIVRGGTVGMYVDSGLEPKITNSRFENNVYHIYWPDSGGQCEILGTEEDTNYFDSAGRIICEGSFPTT